MILDLMRHLSSPISIIYLVYLKGGGSSRDVTRIII